MVLKCVFEILPVKNGREGKVMLFNDVAVIILVGGNINRGTNDVACVNCCALVQWSSIFHLLHLTFQRIIAYTCYGFVGCAIVKIENLIAHAYICAEHNRSIAVLRRNT